LLDGVVARFAPLWERYSPDDYRERIRACAQQPRDMIIIGGSPVSEGIDPSLWLGLSWGGQPIANAYAVGLPGATSSELYFALRQAAPTPPRVLVYGCTASDWNDRRLEPHGPSTLMGWHDLGVWCRHRPESREWMVRHFLQARLAGAWQLYHHRHGIRLATASWAERQFPGSFPESNAEAARNTHYSDAMRYGDGYAPNPDYILARYDEAEDKPTSIPHFARYTLGGHLRYLNWMFDWADANGVEVILVDMPVTADLEKKLHPDEYARYHEQLARIVKERGYRLIKPTREATGLSDADFADVIHLNAAGAQKLTRHLRGALEVSR